MTTIVNRTAADIEVTFPSGNTKTVNMIRLLVQTQNAEFKSAHGMFLPGVGKQHPTVKALREEYEIPLKVARTWDDVAPLLRGFHTDLTEAIQATKVKR